MGGPHWGLNPKVGYKLWWLLPPLSNVGLFSVSCFLRSTYQWHKGFLCHLGRCTRTPILALSVRLCACLSNGVAEVGIFWRKKNDRHKLIIESFSSVIRVPKEFQEMFLTHEGILKWMFTKATSNVEEALTAYKENLPSWQGDLKFLIEILIECR